MHAVLQVIQQCKMATWRYLKEEKNPVLTYETGTASRDEKTTALLATSLAQAEGLGVLNTH
jgi:hypothetical protein